jgi:CBS domain-containing protein
MPRWSLRSAAALRTSQDASAATRAVLHIVQRGLVASRAADPSQNHEPTLGPGECFPIGALSAGGVASKRYSAVQDTFCYLLARDDFLEWRRQSPEFELFCTQAITETLKQSLAQMQSEFSQLAARQQTLAQPLRDLVPGPAGIGPSPRGRKLAMMRDATVRTIVVIGTDGTPVGIFTLIDLLDRVVLADRPLTTPIAKFMSTPLVMLPVTATAGEALQVLAERRIRQLAVVDGAKVVGLVSERDLFALQRVSMRHVGESVRSASDRSSLQRAAADIRALTQNLLAQGATAEPVTRTIASLNDALTRQVIEMVLARHALAESDWCWLALGSEGRGEQTYATDQDNALIFVPQDLADIESERPHLLAFAQTVNANLEAVGFPLCTGNVMASNPDLCLSVDEWKEKFLAWMREPTPAALLQANILFDFRPLYGNATLAERLREWLNSYAQESKLFLRLMAQNALDTEPPLGLIRAFVTDDAEAQKGTLDLKSRGTAFLSMRPRIRAGVRAARNGHGVAPAPRRRAPRDRAPPC